MPAPPPGWLANSRELTGVAQDRHTRDARRDLREQLEPFATDCKFELQESGRITARSRQTRDQAAADRIGAAPQRYSMRMLTSLVQFNSWSRCWNGAT